MFLLWPVSDNCDSHRSPNLLYIYRKRNLFFPLLHYDIRKQSQQKAWKLNQSSGFHCCTIPNDPLRLHHTHSYTKSAAENSKNLSYGPINGPHRPIPALKHTHKHTVRWRRMKIILVCLIITPSNCHYGSHSSVFGIKLKVCVRIWEFPWVCVSVSVEFSAVLAGLQADR